MTEPLYTVKLLIVNDFHANQISDVVRIASETCRERSFQSYQFDLRQPITKQN